MNQAQIDEQIKNQHASELAAQRQVNEEAKQFHEKERVRQKDAERAKTEAFLAPIKLEKQRAWLIEHPGASPADFEKIWSLIREGLQKESIQKAIESKRKSMGSVL